MIFTFAISFTVYGLLGDRVVWLSSSIIGGVWGVTLFEIVEYAPIGKVEKEYITTLTKNMLVSMGLWIFIALTGIVATALGIR